MPRLRQPARSARTAALGCALAIACQASPQRGARGLPPAGTPRDDGSGLLARLSMQPAPPVGAEDGEADRGEGGDGGGAGDGGDGGGVGEGGDGGGGGAGHGGARYAGYEFVPTASYRSTPTPYETGYEVAAVPRGGAITGQVSWRRPPRAAPTIEAPSCGGAVTNDSLIVDAHGRVANAVVWLADIRRGRPLLSLAPSTMYQRRLQVGGVLERRGCRFAPHVQVVAPIGGVLDIVHGDPGRARIAGERGDGQDDEGSELFADELRGAGARTSVLLEQPGLVRVRADDGGDAWVVVAGHPYHAVTDERGRFELPDVPPGRYQLVVWHEPVVRADGTRSEAAVVRRPVRVRAERRTAVDLALR